MMKIKGLASNSQCNSFRTSQWSFTVVSQQFNVILHFLSLSAVH